jgi:hypothetical protein
VPICELRPQNRTYTVRVQECRPETRTHRVPVTTFKTVSQVVTERVPYTRCIPVPYQRTIRVPVVCVD